MEKEVKMTEKQMQEFVQSNINLVPRNHKGKFATLSLEQKVKKIEFYQEAKTRREYWMKMNSTPMKVKQLFEKRNSSIQDVQEVIEICQEYIENFKQIEIDKIDEQIRQLEKIKSEII